VWSFGFYCTLYHSFIVVNAFCEARIVHVALVALNALPAIDASVRGPIGGIETRAWLFAQGLARQPDTSVSLVIRHHQALAASHRANVEIVPLIDRLYPVWQSVGTAIGRQSRFPWITVRHCHPRLLWQLPVVAVDRLLRGRRYSATRSDRRLAAVNADVYATFGVQTHSLTVIRTAHELGRPAVLSLGSDGDLDPLFAGDSDGFDPYGTRAAVGREILHSADAIVVQTDAQQALLRERFGRDGQLIENPIDVAAWDAGRRHRWDLPELAGVERSVLWVGRAEDVHKRPRLCLDIARLCPEITFLMLLSPRDAVVEAEVRAGAPANVRIVRHVPFESMPAVFSKAAAFLSTSSLEGFPNVFLQAALSDVPIVSMEVGEDFLRSANAGVVCRGGIAEAADVLRKQWEAPVAISGTQKAREFVVAHHGLDQQSARLAAALKGAIAQRSPKPSIPDRP
jgi:hypothetical protein